MINKKGFTIAEIVVSFSLLSVIFISVIGTTVFYRNKMKEEEVITQLTDFKNVITKAIYDDILSHDDNEIVSVSSCIGIDNCVNFIDKENNSHILRILEYTNNNSNPGNGVYLSYNDNLYMLPDSDLYTFSEEDIVGAIPERVCDFVGGFNVDHYEEDSIELYTVKISFEHKDYEKELDISVTITHNDAND